MKNKKYLIHVEFEVDVDFRLKKSLIPYELNKIGKSVKDVIVTKYCDAVKTVTKIKKEYMDYTIDEIEDYLIESSNATQDEINLVVLIMGRSHETVSAILFARTGYECLSQIYDQDLF